MSVAVELVSFNCGDFGVRDVVEDVVNWIPVSQAGLNALTWASRELRHGSARSQSWNGAMFVCRGGCHARAHCDTVSLADFPPHVREEAISRLSKLNLGHVNTLCVEGLPPSLSFACLCTSTIVDLDVSNTRVGTLEFVSKTLLLERLHAANCSLGNGDVRYAAKLKCLAELNLSGNQKVSDVKCLVNCRALERLYLAFTGVTDDAVEHLKMMPLTVLSLSGCAELQNVRPLVSIPSLQNLDVSFTNASLAQASDPTLTHSCSFLRVLNVNGCQQLAPLDDDITGSLETLYAGYTNLNNDWLGKAAIQSLHTLCLNGCGNVSELAWLRSMHLLVELHLTGTGLTNESIQALKDEIPHRNLLRLSLCEVCVTDLTPIVAVFPELLELRVSNLDGIGDVFVPVGQLPHLEVLVANASPCSDVSALVTCPQLRELSASHNQIQDVTPISHLAQLEFIDFSSTRVSDLGAIACCHKVRVLDVSDAEITDAAIPPLTGMPLLEVLFLSNNKQIHDVEALGSCLALRRLFIAGLGNLTTTSVVAVVRLSTLEFLDLSDNPGVNLSEVLPGPNLQVLHAIGMTVSTEDQARLTKTLKELVLAPPE